MKRFDLATIDPSDPAHFQNGDWRPLFAQLRAEAPVFYCANGRDGPFWSVTRYDDIFTVETDSARFSSAFENGGVVLESRPTQSLMQTDPPAHTGRRKAVMPLVTPKNLKALEGLIRSRTVRVVESLPRNETFDWVQTVSVELTSMMLATIFGRPPEEGRQMTHWSDVMTADLNDPSSPIRTEEERVASMRQLFHRMLDLVKQKRADPGGSDIINLIAQSPQYANATPTELTSELGVFLVGGNDTTRNSMSGGVWGFHQFPEQREKLAADRSLMPKAINEIIRYQSPIIYQRRTATEDVELRGQTIRKGDKVALWYASANRDEDVFPDGERIDIERRHVLRHLAFGTGPHRCVGAKLAELQLRILWEELLDRDIRIEVLSEPVMAYSNFGRSVLSMPVRIKS